MGSAHKPICLQIYGAINNLLWVQPEIYLVLVGFDLTTLSIMARHSPNLDTRPMRAYSSLLPLFWNMNLISFILLHNIMRVYKLCTRAMKLKISLSHYFMFM